MLDLSKTVKNLIRHRHHWDKLMQAAAARRPLAQSSNSPDGHLREVTGFGSNPGALRMFMYVPERLAPSPALVVALHGCTQNATSYDHGSGWATLASQHGFAVLLPEQQPANNPKNCFSWFQPSDTARGRGEALSISQMVERANRLLCESMQQSRYATLVCVQTAASGEAAVCNAGHCPPLVFGASGASLIDSTGLPLGMFCNGSFPCTNLRLDKGDTLLLYSDGLVESENSRGEEYGVDRLQLSLRDARTLPNAEAVVQKSLSGLQSFLDGARPGDDITLMAIRRM